MSACHSATMCQCRRRDVTLACGTRIGPGWGSTSLHRITIRGVKTRRYPAGGGGGVELLPHQRGGGGKEGSTHPTHVLSHQWLEGAKGGAKGAAKHACRLILAPGPATPWSHGRRRSASQGALTGWRRGRRRARRRPAFSKRQGGGGGWAAQGVTLLPFPGDAASFLGDLVQEVLVKPRVDASEEVRPQGRGMDLPRAAGWPTTRP